MVLEDYCFPPWPLEWGARIGAVSHGLQDVAEVILRCGLQCHQYMYDMQLCLDIPLDPNGRTLEPVLGESNRMDEGKQVASCILAKWR